MLQRLQRFAWKAAVTVTLVSRLLGRWLGDMARRVWSGRG
jgi:hypothetical protein